MSFFQSFSKKFGPVDYLLTKQKKNNNDDVSI
jgi:hypothetical protein